MRIILPSDFSVNKNLKKKIKTRIKCHEDRERLVKQTMIGPNVIGTLLEKQPMYILIPLVIKTKKANMKTYII